MLGRPLFGYTLQVFEDDDDCEDIILVVKSEDLDRFQAIAGRHNFNKIRSYVICGNERQNRVRHGLLRILGDGVVLIHDGTRPFVSEELIYYKWSCDHMIIKATTAERLVFTRCKKGIAVQAVCLIEKTGLK